MADAAPRAGAARLRLAVVGAGVAGLEALVALHALAPGRIDATLVDPGESFRLRALDVGEPFGMRRARRYPLAEIASDLGVELVSGRLHRVNHEARAAVLRSGEWIGYDALLLAVGARPYPALTEGVLFDPVHGRDTLTGLAARPAGHTAVVVPSGVGWTLPAYELALLLSTQPGATVTLVTAERTPLEAFGAPGAQLAREELATAGVTLISAVQAAAASPTRLTFAGSSGLDVDRIVHLPRHVRAGYPGRPVRRVRLHHDRRGRGGHRDGGRVCRRRRHVRCREARWPGRPAGRGGGPRDRGAGGPRARPGACTAGGARHSLDPARNAVPERRGARRRRGGLWPSTLVATDQGGVDVAHTLADDA